VFEKLSNIACSWMERISGLALVVIMLLTGCDVAGRMLKMPVPGTFEVVTFAGGLIIGLAVPMSTKLKEQVRIDIMTERLPRAIKLPLETITRLIGMAFFMVVSYALVQMGND